MKVLLTLMIMAFASATTSAQDVNANKTINPYKTSKATADTMPKALDSHTTSRTHKYNMPEVADNAPEAIPTDTMHIPRMNAYGQVAPINMYPSNWGGWHNWELHKGLNLNVGTSVFAQFGKNARHGAGFAQNISAMYAVPLTNKLSVTMGGYLNNIYWAHDNYRDAGLSAVLGYKFNEHWEAYAYGQKSLVNNHNMPYPLYDTNNVGDRIGAAVKYNFNKNASIQISVESHSLPTQRPFLMDQPSLPTTHP